MRYKSLSTIFYSNIFFTENKYLVSSKFFLLNLFNFEDVAFFYLFSSLVTHKTGVVKK